MSKIKSYLDSKYSKISFYVICTAVIIFFLCILISMSGGFFQKIFTVIGLVLKPIIAGGVIAYLFEPVLQWLEKRIKAKNPRLIALVITIVVLIFGEITPKNAAAVKSEGLALFYSRIRSTTSRNMYRNGSPNTASTSARSPAASAARSPASPVRLPIFSSQPFLRSTS